MTIDSPCAKCGSADFFVVDPVRQPDPTALSALETTLAVVVHMRKRTDAGPLRALVCARCGRVELYASDLERLAALSSDPSSGVTRARSG